jgi:Rab-like protein 2
MADTASTARAIAEADSLKTADLKIIMLGDSAVGKSKLVERFLLQEYCPRTLSTYALTMFRHDHTDQETGINYAIDFWDTAGQEQFNKLHGSYYYQANACILGFDVTRKITYKNLQTWYKELRHYCPDIPVICVANKVDVDPSMAKKAFNFPRDNNIPFYFVSAAEGTNVVKVFCEAIKLAIKNKEEPTDEVMAEIMNLLRDEEVPTSSAECYDATISSCTTRSPTPS